MSAMKKIWEIIKKIFKGIWLVVKAIVGVITGLMKSQWEKWDKEFEEQEKQKKKGDEN